MSAIAALLPDWLAAAGIATAAAVLGVYLVAGFVKGTLGFGLPVVAVTTLPFLVPVEQALTLNSMVILATNLQQILQGGDRRAALASAWPLMLGMAVMVPVAARFAVGIEAATLMLILGGFVLAFVAVSLARPGLRIAPARRVPAGVAMGLLSGFVGAITSSPGPIFVSYVVALGLSRQVYMTALGFIMSLFGVMLAGSYAAVGMLDADDLPFGLACVVPAVVGMALGNAVGRRFGAERFRLLVLGVLAVLAVVMIRRALF